MNLDEHWYVLLTIRSKEEEVCKYLNENEGIFAFSPLTKNISIIKTLNNNALNGK